MGIRKLVRDGLRAVGHRNPRLRGSLLEWDRRFDAARHAVAEHVPALIRPEPRNLTVAVTARCNLRCEGCRYGRDFMPGAELPLEVVRTLCDDAAALGFRDLRLYGGEPLLHRDLPAMVEHARTRELRPVQCTTNATLLERRIDELWAAGLRCATVGFYGTGADYDAYCHRRGAFRRVEQGLFAVRERYGDEFELRLNWLLSRASCDPRVVTGVLEFARRLRASVQVDLVHYSLPVLLTEGPDRWLQFRPEDRASIDAVVDVLLQVKRAEPERLDHTEMGLRSIPDWLILGPRMRVPCDKYRMLWVGADGTVQLCYVTFRLGNLHEHRLREMVNTAAHKRAARCVRAELSQLPLQLRLADVTSHAESAALRLTVGDVASRTGAPDMPSDRPR